MIFPVLRLHFCLFCRNNALRHSKICMPPVVSDTGHSGKTSELDPHNTKNQNYNKKPSREIKPVVGVAGDVLSTQL